MIKTNCKTMIISREREKEENTVSEPSRLTSGTKMYCKKTKNTINLDSSKRIDTSSPSYTNSKMTTGKYILKY